jgi:hypothetical protein
VRQIWTRAPLSLRAYAVLTIGWSVVSIALTPSLVPLVFLPVNLVWTYFLLRGVEWLWIVTIVLAVFALVTSPLIEFRWYLVVVELAQLVLLLLPETRRFFRRGERTVAIH